MKDSFNENEVRRMISPTRGTGNTPLVSQIIDLQGKESMLIAIAIGTLADADATFTTLVEHDDDSALGSAASVPDAQLLGTESGASFTFANDDEVRKIGYIGDKRYVRLTITPASNDAGNHDLSAVAILGHARKGPQSSQS